MGDGLYYACSGEQLVAANAGDGYILPLFPRLADVEEFLVGAGIEGRGQDILCPDHLRDLCRLCVPKPGVKWIVMGPAPKTDLYCDKEELLPAERFLAAFRKVYAQDTGEDVD